MIYRFADCRIDVAKFELHRKGALQAVEPQVLSLLIHLLRYRDRVVSKDELIETVWEGRIVSDATLTSRISSARRAVGCDGRAQAVIRTVPRRGLRFVAGVHTENALVSGPDAGQTRYCTARGGARIAFSSTGSGPVLVKTSSWINHLDQDWHSPVFRDMFSEFAGYTALVRYDSRGVGLSDQTTPPASFDDLVADLEAVAAHLPERFALLGMSQGAAIAIEFAARYPERVSHLVLWGGYARGRNRRGDPEDAARSAAMATLMRQGWGKQSSAFRRMFAALYLPEANEEQVRWWIDLQRIAARPETAVALRQMIDDIDVSHRLAKIAAPVLIVHSERDEVAPISEARFLAASLSDCALCLLDSANHLVMPQEPAWARAMHRIRAFLRAPTAGSIQEPGLGPIQGQETQGQETSGTK